MTPTILFGQSYYLKFDAKLLSAQQPYAPLGTLYAAACARARGYQVALFDAMLAESEHEWASALDRHVPVVAVIYEDSFNYLSKMCLLRMREAAATMIRSARERGVTTIVAGSDASDHPSIYLDAGADVVVHGEGELTLVETLDAIIGRGPLVPDVAGISRRNGRGGIIRTPPREFIRDLDTLPPPAWDLVDVERYRSIWLKRHGYFSMNLATTRGCPYHCNWCAKPIYGQRYAVRSPEHVARELEYLSKTYKPDHLWIVDDIFGLTPGWIESFAALLAQRGVRIPFKCLLRADGVTEKTAKALRDAGARTAWIGAESGSQKILDAMEKGTRVEQIRGATRLLHAQGIEVGFFLQFGYPGETLEDIERTLDMVRECRPDDVGISVSYPLPGTPFHERVKAELGKKQNWVDSDDLAMMYRGSFVPEFYRALHQLVHAEFKARSVARGFFGHSATAPMVHQSPVRRMREALSGINQAIRIPLLRQRVLRLSRMSSGPTIPPLIPLMKRQAAAVPTEQTR